VRLLWQTGLYDHARLHVFLRHCIYRDQTLLALLIPAAWRGLAVFILGLSGGIAKDAARARQRKEDRRLKGPELVTPVQFNRLQRADGVGFLQQYGWAARLVGRPDGSVCRARGRPIISSSWATPAPASPR
jgi:hypothetical protein